MKKFITFILFFTLKSSVQELNNANINQISQDNKSDIKQPENNLQNEENLNKLVSLLFDKEAFKQTFKENFTKELDLQSTEATKNYLNKFKKDEVINDLINKILSQELINELKNIIKKYYDAQEITELLKFYESSIGKKMLKIMPELCNEFNQNTIKVTQEISNKYFNNDSEQEIQFSEQNNKVS